MELRPPPHFWEQVGKWMEKKEINCEIDVMWSYRYAMPVPSPFPSPSPRIRVLMILRKCHFFCLFWMSLAPTFPTGLYGTIWLILSSQTGTIYIYNIKINYRTFYLTMITALNKFQNLFQYFAIKCIEKLV